jgi:hypothetical protein
MDDRQHSKTQSHATQWLSRSRRFAKMTRIHAAVPITLAGLLLVLPFSAANALGEARPTPTRHLRAATESGEAKFVEELPGDGAEIPVLIESVGIDMADVNRYHPNTGRASPVPIVLYSPDKTSLSCIETNNRKPACRTAGGAGQLIQLHGTPQPFP